MAFDEELKPWQIILTVVAIGLGIAGYCWYIRAGGHAAQDYNDEQAQLQAALVEEAAHHINIPLKPEANGYVKCRECAFENFKVCKTCTMCNAKLAVTVEVVATLSAVDAKMQQKV